MISSTTQLPDMLLPTGATAVDSVKGEGVIATQGTFKVSGLSFRPKTVIAILGVNSSTFAMTFHTMDLQMFHSSQNYFLSHYVMNSGNGTCWVTGSERHSLESNGFTLNFTGSSSYSAPGTKVRWIAYG